MAKVWRPVGDGGSRRRGSAWQASAAALAAVAGQGPVAAADTGEQPASGREMWAGADVSRNVWLAYSGITLAPWSGIHDDGWRFRAAGGYGAYRYDSTVWDTTRKDTREQRFDARTYYADILVGYLKRFGPLTAKGFVGASVISHDIAPLDEQAVAFGEEVGVKGVIELWLNIGEQGWGSLDLSWTSAHETRAARGRLGYRVSPWVSLGVEGAINVDAQSDCRVSGSDASRCNLLSEEIDKADLLDYARGGVFARYEWGTGEISLSAGVLGESFGSGRHDGTDVAPYVTFNWLTHF